MEKQATALIKNLWRAYLTERDMPMLLDLFDAGVTWFGTGRHEFCNNADRAMEMLFNEQEEWNGHFQITNEWCEAQQLDETRYLVYGEFAAVDESEPKLLADMDVRYSILCNYTGDKLKVTHIHMSNPNPDQLLGEFYPRSITEERNQQLREKIEQKVSELEKISREARENEARYRLALEATNDIILEVDFETKTIFTNNAKMGDDIGLLPFYRITEDDPRPYHDRIHPEDRKALYRQLTQEELQQIVRDGRRSATVECRVLNAQMEYVWMSAAFIPIENARGQIVKVIGKIKNIDEQKRKLLTIEMQSMRDPLTGLYNKSFTESMINQYLTTTTGACGSLFIIDVDNFKQVNDAFGHLLGDAVLTDIADKVQRLFRGNDVVGRIGGDEFLVFMKSVQSIETVQIKAQALVETLKRCFPSRQEEIHLSVSIGVAISPRDGTDFKLLYDKADNALYRAKGEGKDGFAIYNSRKDHERHHYHEHTRVESVENGRLIRENITEYIFRILYDTKDLSSAVYLILELVGRQFDVSRAYIFENSSDEKRTTNTFEWCNDEIEPVFERFQDVPISPVYLGRLAAEGVLYCDDIVALPAEVRAFHEPQQIHAMLQCALMDEGVLRGFVGFDECSGQRFWTQDEVETLALIAKILSAFLIKMRAQDRLQRAVRTSQQILDHMNIMAYVADPKSYQLLFLNQKLQELSPRAQPGECCYKTLWNRDTPCERCPMDALRLDSGDSCTREMYNAFLRRWVSATASTMPWEDGEQVTLMSCYDVTPFREE